MPRTAEENERIRAVTSAAIVDSAMALFARRGYAHTTVRHIAEDAEISIGLMYHYFDGKADLLQAVFQNCMEIISRAFEAAVRDSASGRAVPAILRTIFAMLRRDPDFWGLFYMMRTQPAVMEILGDAFRLWTKRLRDIFVDEMATAGRPEPELEALLLYSMVEGTIQQYLLEPAGYPLESVADRIIAFATAQDSETVQERTRAQT